MSNKNLTSGPTQGVSVPLYPASERDPGGKRPWLGPFFARVASVVLVVLVVLVINVTVNVTVNGPINFDSNNPVNGFNTVNVSNNTINGSNNIGSLIGAGK